MSTSPATRYAIYFVPAADTVLHRFGASVLGYDSYTGRETAWVDGADAAVWRGYVREPAVYGFHATLKPPFHLASGYDETDLVRAVLDFAQNHAVVPMGELTVRELGSFIALVPTTPHPLLDRLAESCVRDFDRFRSTMSEQERARRLTPGLSDRQIENLVRWGYPYVFEDFRFHMTLTGSLATQKRDQALRFLCDKFEQMPGSTPLALDQIVLVRQADQASSFQAVQCAPLGHSPVRPFAYSC